MPLDVDRLADVVLEGTRALIAKSLAPLVAENDALSAQCAELCARLAVVEGRDMVGPVKEAADAVARAITAIEAIPPAAELPDIPAMVQEAVSAAVDAIPTPDAPDVAPMIDAAVAAAVAALPADAGIATLRAEMSDLRTSIPEPPDLSGFALKSDIAAAIDAMPETKDYSLEIEAVFQKAADRIEAIAIPEPPDLSGFALKSDIPSLPDFDEFARKDEIPENCSAAVADLARGVGEKAAEISELRNRLDSINVPDAIPGRDGVGIAEIRQNADGELIVKLTNGETYNAGKVRGADGLGFEHMSTEWDGERTLTLSFTRGGRTEVTALTLPCIIDRGVWREGGFERGDAVTWGGSLWIAQRDTSDKPETSDAWRLAAKRGRDGKDFRPDDNAPRAPLRVGKPSK